MSGSTVTKSGKKRMTVLHDNPPLPGKKFFLVSMISPESPQKHDVHGFKIHDMCETEEEAKELGSYYRNLDPDFDVSVGVVGKWLPWLFDVMAVQNIEYANDQLTNLVKSHRTSKRSGDTTWREDVDKHIEEIQKAGTKEGQEALAAQKEPAVSLLFKIKQLELTIKRRRNELENLQEVFHTQYNKEDRAAAKKVELPLSEPQPMQYTMLSSAPAEDSRISGPFPVAQSVERSVEPQSNNSVERSIEESLERMVEYNSEPENAMTL